MNFRNKKATEAATSNGLKRKDSLSTAEMSMTSGSSHKEKHSQIGEYMSDAILGFADGLTVPFALTAGLSAYVLSNTTVCAGTKANKIPSVGSIRIVIVGGLAELFAGAISMGLGAWLAAESDRKAYYVEEEREKREVQDMPEKEEEEIYEIFDQYHISRAASKAVVDGLKANPDVWVQARLSVFLLHPTL